MHDDIAFALDNLGLDHKEERIKKALKDVKMEDFEEASAYNLSLGQKQRVTIAGLLSVNPKVIVADEPTAMLDPQGKEDIKSLILELKQKGYTIVYVTNVIDEVLLSDRIVVLEEGKIAKEFETRNILENVEFLKSKGICVPKAIETRKKLEEKGIEIDISELI